jgi:hypothetical protein
VGQLCGAISEAMLVSTSKKRRKPAAAVAQGGGRGTLNVLDDDTLQTVLAGLKGHRALAALGTSSRQLCSTLRSTVPVVLHVRDQAQIDLLSRLQASGRPPFSACTQLSITTGEASSCLEAVGVFKAPQHWTSLQQLQLEVVPSWKARLQKPDVTLDDYTSRLLGHLTGLQQLRSLQLTGAGFGACSARQMGALQQLTKLQLTASRSAADAAADLSPLSLLSNLKELWMAPAPAVQPAASSAGPYSLPSSLQWLEVVGIDDGATVACWATHLPACRQLRQLDLTFGYWPHASVHPGLLVEALAQHNPQLRSLGVWCNFLKDQLQWCPSVAGLPDVAGPVGMEWRPSPALAALTGLEELRGYPLSVKSQADWEVLAQLRGLTRWVSADLHCAPAEGVTLGVVELEYCDASLSGGDLGRVLLACTALQRAHVFVHGASPPLVPQLVGPPLPAHHSLSRLQVFYRPSVAAAPHFAAFAPVLASVHVLAIYDWPKRTKDHTGSGLPALSHCTALRELHLNCCYRDDPASTLSPPPVQDFVLMLAPVSQLKRLHVSYAPGFNARGVVVLQHMLPRLRRVLMQGCGSTVRAVAGSSHEQRMQREQRALRLVKQLLRPKLRLKSR